MSPLLYNSYYKTLPISSNMLHIVALNTTSNQDIQFSENYNCIIVLFQTIEESVLMQ